MSVLIEVPNKAFDYYVTALRGQYDNNLSKLVYDCTRELFALRKNPTKWFKAIPVKKMQAGKFYFILYDYNGLSVFIPVFVIDYRVTDKTNHVIYIINLDFLPFDYKKTYFNMVYIKAKNIFENNSYASDVLAESNIPINFEVAYNSLKNNGNFNFAISACNLNKIKEVYAVSTNLMYVMIHVHMRPVNVKLMKQLMDTYEKGNDIYEKLNKLISELEQMSESYDTDIVEYYKKLKALEANYKLFENE